MTRAQRFSRRVLLRLALAPLLAPLAPVPAPATALAAGGPPAAPVGGHPRTAWPPAPDRPGPDAPPGRSAFLDPTLQRLVQDVLGRGASAYSVVVESLVDGRRAAVNADRQMEAASIFKLYVMYEVFRQERLGRLTFDTVLTVTERAASLSLGLSTPAAGTRITVRQALERMIQVSDNTCAVLLGDYVGWTRMRDALREIDIRDTEFWPEVETTAEDVARLLYLIGTDQAVDREASEDMLDILLGQQWNDRLPKGLPPNVRIGHKTGEYDGYLHDAGIVCAPFGRYVIAVLSQGGSPRVFAELARLVHAYLAALAADVF